MPEIIVKLGDRVVQKYLLYKDQRMSIGRAPDNDIALENPAVSRRHASVQQLNGRYILEDNNSANGTYVNGVRISKTEILDKDVITIGKHKLHFYNQDVAREGGAPAEAAPASEPGAVVAALRVMQGKQRDQLFPLGEGDTRIGRAADNDIRLHDWFVSKHHAIVSRRGGSFVIRDLDSWRHTMVNGEVVTEATLKPGDEVQFGPKISMRFEGVAAGEAVEGEGRRPVELGEPPADLPEEIPGEDDGPQPVDLDAAPNLDVEAEAPAPAEAEADEASEEEAHPLERTAGPEAIEEGAASEAAPAEASPSEAAPAPAGDLDPAVAEEVAMWEKALANPSPAIRKQAARKLKKLTGRDYDV